MNKMKYYTEEEKQILINFFTNEGSNSKKNFNEYLNNYVKTNGIRVAEHLLLKESTNWKSPEKEKLLNPANWIYNSKHILWNNEQEDNAVTYLLSLHNFNASGTSLKNLDKLKPNWNHQNKDGNTALHLFAEEKIYSCIEKLLQLDPTIDTNLENKKGETFGKILLDKALFNVRNDYDETEFIKFVTFVQKLTGILNNNGQALYNLAPEKLKIYLEAIDPAIELLVDNVSKIKKFSKEITINSTTDYYKKLELYLKEVHYYAQVSSKIPEKTKLVKKLKI